jgi:Spy/CpxP family protein refolding chaperone
MTTRLARRLALALLTAGALSLPAAPAFAQSDKAALAQRLVSPKQLLDHADDLALTDAQVKALRQNKRSTHEDTRALRADLEARTRELTRLLDTPGAATRDILAAADRVMAAETAIKRRHLTSVLDARATLDDRQRKMVLDYLGNLREQRRERRKKKLRKQLERLEREDP